MAERITDEAFREAEAQNPLPPPPPPTALRAQPCRCEHPSTYQDEDGERRCLCGRAVKP